MCCEHLKWLSTSEVLCHTTGRSNCAWDRELWQYWTSVNYKYLHLHFPWQGTCHAGFRGKTMNATMHHKRHLLACVPGAELLSCTRGIPVLQSLLPGWWQCKKRTYPKPWLISCSAPVRIGSMLLKAVSLQRAPCHKPKWAQVAFGLVLCLSSTSIALAGSWSSHQEGAAPVSPPGVVQIHLQGTPARSGSTCVPRPQGVL